MSRWLYWLCVVGLVLLSGYCFMWSFQTAWLGSFPGRDIHVYSVRFYWQLLAAVVFLALAVVVGLRYRRREPTRAVPNDG